MAPTRIVLDERDRSAEAVLSNTGDKETTYRISLELRRMTSEGQLSDVSDATETEAQALQLISYAPRRITLGPGQSQAVRIAVRKPAGLASGEYRAHMVFRPVPENPPAPGPAGDPAAGLSIRLTPLVGIVIPVIVRQGPLEATAGIAGARLLRENGRDAISIELTRSGSKSVYGEIRVHKPGMTEPVARAKGIAVYPELAQRSVVLPIAPGTRGPVTGPATIRYVETTPQGERVLAEASVTLR